MIWVKANSVRTTWPHMQLLQSDDLPGLGLCYPLGSLDRGRNVVNQNSTSAGEIHVARHQQMLPHLRRMVSENTGFR